MARRRKSRSKKSQPQYVIWIGIALLIILAVAFSSYFTQAANISLATNDNAGLPLDISVQEAHQMRDAGAYILDVRTVSEWEDAHIPDATLIVLDTLANQLDQIPKDQNIVVICRSGNRSQVGRDILLSAGFTNVTSVSGGMNAWIASGYDYVTGP